MREQDDLALTGHEVVDALSAQPLDGDHALDALARLAALRRALDETERDLIAAARDHHVSWGAIAAALGLRSRQAAEQRWLRLAAPATRDATAGRQDRRRQRIIDASPLSALRQAAWEAASELDSDPGWDARHARAALARTTLELAGSTSTGALFGLVQQAIADLDQVPLRGLTEGPRRSLRRLRAAFAAATPPTPTAEPALT